MAKKTNELSHAPAKKDVEEFEMLYPLLDGLLSEVKALSQKKQDGALNPYKVKMINKVLSKVRNLLVNDPSSEFLELLDEDTIPTNSDALFMIVQFKSAMQQFKTKYYVRVQNDDDYLNPGIAFEWKTKD
jgi:hypothetical protein